MEAFLAGQCEFKLKGFRHAEAARCQHDRGRVRGDLGSDSEGAAGSYSTIAPPIRIAAAAASSTCHARITQVCSDSSASFAGDADVAAAWAVQSESTELQLHGQWRAFGRGARGGSGATET